jgi:hypothetical protein
MRTFSRVSLLLAALWASGSAVAQAPKLTWVRHFKNPQDVSLLRERFATLTAGNRVLSWGVLEPVTHIGEPWAQLVYASVPDWAAIETVAGVFRAGRAGDVYDVVLRHTIQTDKEPSFKPKYVVINLHPVTRGRDSDAWALFNEWAKPVFVDLESKGKLGPWFLAVQSVAVDNEWTYAVWYFLNDLSTLDEVDAQLAALPPGRLGTYERRLREMSEDDYRGHLFRVVELAP